MTKYYLMKKTYQMILIKVTLHSLDLSLCLLNHHAQTHRIPLMGAGGCMKHFNSKDLLFSVISINKTNLIVLNLK